MVAVANRHNYIKVKSLYFLHLRKREGKPWTTAGQIVRYAMVSNKSLYVLLSRWVKWGYVNRMDATPYSYSIATQGERYLQDLPKWYDYQEEAYRQVAWNTELTLYWRNKKYERTNSVSTIKYPFQDADDYRIFIPNGKSRMTVNVGHIAIECRNCIEAVLMVDKLGLTCGMPLKEKLVEVGYIRWKEPTE